ncbi:MAG: DUF4097 family beta strand repeat-containing protein [candidate division Zixibacteria bacterium]|nr:DUF4097 family beta strand repeat-containing protein [candidate division Zixibacteria bacterium]
MKKIQILLFVSLMLTGISAYGDSFSFKFQKDIEISGRSELNIKNIAGLIEITGAEVDKISIGATKTVKAADQEEAEKIARQIEIEVSTNNNRVSIQTVLSKATGSSRSLMEKIFGSGNDTFGAVDYTITVPNGCLARIENISGNIHVSDIANNVNIIVTSGNIELDGITGSVDIDAISGNMIIQDVKGNVNITATSSNTELNSITGATDICLTSGNTKGTSLMGPVTIAQTSGDVTMDSLSGDIKIKSISGDISIEQDEGAIDITVYSGNVDIKTEFNSQKDFYIETGSGKIVFAVPETSSGSARLETISGNITTELPISIRTFSKDKLLGDFGGGGPKISLITTSGDIIIRQY